MFERLTLNLVNRISLPIVRARVHGNVLAFDEWPPLDEEYVVLIVTEGREVDVRLMQREMLSLLPKADTATGVEEKCAKQFLWSSD